MHAMRPVFTCQSCGFTSNLGREYTRHEGLLVCHCCAADADKDPDVTRWIGEALARAAATSAP